MGGGYGGDGHAEERSRNPGINADEAGVTYGSTRSLCDQRKDSRRRDDERPGRSPRQQGSQRFGIEMIGVRVTAKDNIGESEFRRIYNPATDARMRLVSGGVLDGQ